MTLDDIDKIEAGLSDERLREMQASLMPPTGMAVISGKDLDDTRAVIAELLARRGLAAGDAAPATSEPLDGNRPLPFDRETLGQMVREAWVRWAHSQPNPKPSWLVPYSELAEPDKEADRQIGEAIARWTLIGDAASRAAPAKGE
jgi:hypothetical protein